MKGSISKKKNTKSRFGRIVLGILSTLLVFVLTIGLAGVIFYKSGEAALKASASTQAPVIEVDQQEVEKIKESYEYRNTVAWQEDWVTYGNEVYEYNEDTINFLLMGIDHAGELGKETDLSDWNAGQADTIFLISLNQKDSKVSVIGIPRNTMLEVDIYNEEEQCIDTIYNQICLQYGYAGGGELGLVTMKNCVSELFYQLPIHGACAISFDAIGVIVDMLGGIEVTIPDDMTAHNPEYVQGSRLVLTKKNVISYLRYREFSALGSPTTRLTRQKEFLKEAIKVGIAKIKENPMLVSDIYKAIIPYMNTDITLDKAVYLATESLDYSISNDSFYQLTGEDKQVDFVSEGGTTDFYNDYYLNEDTLRATVMEIFYDRVVIK